LLDLYLSWCFGVARPQVVLHCGNYLIQALIFFIQNPLVNLAVHYGRFADVVAADLSKTVFLPPGGTGSTRQEDQLWPAVEPLWPNRCTGRNPRNPGKYCPRKVLASAMFDLTLQILHGIFTASEDAG
jgi:hypothetical protein